MRRTRKSNGKNRNNTPDIFADLEQAAIYEQMAAKKNKRHGSPCDILIHSVRGRLADPDGVSGKAAIDGLVLCGILQDDSAKFVREVRFSQEKATDQKEKTIITLTFQKEN